MLQSIRTKFGSDTILIGVDLNGVSNDNHRPDLLQPAMCQIDVLHLNEEEAEILAGVQKNDLFHESGKTLQIVTEALHQQGCAVVVLSLGSKGSYISVTSDSDRVKLCPRLFETIGSHNRRFECQPLRLHPEMSMPMVRAMHCLPGFVLLRRRWKERHWNKREPLRPW